MSQQQDAQSAPCEDGGCGLPPGGVLHRPSQMGRPPSAVTSGRLRRAAGSSSVRLSIIVAIFRGIHFNVTYPVMSILDKKLGSIDLITLVSITSWTNGGTSSCTRVLSAKRRERITSSRRLDLVLILRAEFGLLLLRITVCTQQ